MMDDRTQAMWLYADVRQVQTDLERTADGWHELILAGAEIPEDTARRVSDALRAIGEVLREMEGELDDLMEAGD